jgi:thiamine pyrophosphate-dependent acetolactate synthase large subunit-like protein
VGDGSLLMNLGCLVTIAAAGPENLSLLVFDNQAYEVTGGQPTPAALVQGDVVDWTAMVRAAGFPLVNRIDTLEEWKDEVPRITSHTGLACTILNVAAERDAGPVGPLAPARERAAEFAAALARHPAE